MTEQNCVFYFIWKWLKQSLKWSIRFWLKNRLERCLLLSVALKHWILRYGCQKVPRFSTTFTAPSPPWYYGFIGNYGALLHEWHNNVLLWWPSSNVSYNNLSVLEPAGSLARLPLPLVFYGAGTGCFWLVLAVFIRVMVVYMLGLLVGWTWLCLFCVWLLYCWWFSCFNIRTSSLLQSVNTLSYQHRRYQWEGQAAFSVLTPYQVFPFSWEAFEVKMTLSSTDQTHTAVYRWLHV